MGWKEVATAIEEAARELGEEAAQAPENHPHRDSMAVMAEEMLDVAHRLKDLKDRVNAGPPTKKSSGPEH